MRVFARQTGFSLLEVLVVIGIMAVLSTLVLGLGKSIKEQARENLCKSEMKILVTAIQQYYSEYDAFPFSTIPDAVSTGSSSGVFDQSDLVWHFDKAFSGLTVAEPSISNLKEDSFATSEALYFYLNRNPVSKQFLGTIDGSLVASGDRDGNARVYGVGVVDLTLFRFVDPWGNPIRYEYSAGDAFVILSSAGADDKWNTGDDIKAE